MDEHVSIVIEDVRVKRHSRPESRSKAGRSTGYSAKYVAGLRVRNRIYSALLVVKAMAILIMMLGGHCE